MEELQLIAEKQKATKQRRRLITAKKVPGTQPFQSMQLTKEVIDLELQIAALKRRLDDKSKQLETAMKDEGVRSVVTTGVGEACYESPKPRASNWIEPGDLVGELGDEKAHACMKVTLAEAKKALTTQQYNILLKSKDGKPGTPRLVVRPTFEYKDNFAAEADA